ncbi:DMT family transporter [Palleronia pelagia]|uniref:Permease of the drug/metabolite transporter (DMT) superfamily n=1 Tax=Palleronia pelagia TaxID=387096 RepID=A0A1H8BTC4_9RHOB|nr:DMT family transporter [Palleronia pelagia]SEM86110.1 Permease of the drug/metabolite transporter (DMT) superfamily [Palleronia pelagia]
MTLSATDTPAPQTMRAALWMTGAIVSFTSMAVAGRAVSIELDTFELMMYRSFIGIVLVVAVARLAGTLNQVRARRMGLHVVRNVFHFSGQNLWFYAITVIPLAQVFALEFTSPIWVALAAPLLLGERLTRMRMLAALIGFVGVLVVARPNVDGIGVGQIAAAGAAIGFAGSAVFTKVLTRTETITCILFWLTVIQAVFGLVCAGWDGDLALPSPATAPWLVLIGCAGLAAHFCLTSALSIAPATLVIPFDFLRLPVIATIGMMFYGEPFDGYVLLGAALIFGANYVNIWVENRARRTAPVA